MTGPLKNARHERYAQELAQGKTATEAMKAAGYTDPRNSTRLTKNHEISARVDELKAQATEIVVDRLAVTKERVLGELAKIGFSDIRKAVRWNGQHVTEQDNPEGGEVLVIKETRNNLVALVDSDDLDDATAAAIAEVSQNAQGGIKIKMYDKRAALVDLGKHLGLFKDEKDGPGTVNIQININTNDAGML